VDIRNFFNNRNFTFYVLDKKSVIQQLDFKCEIYDLNLLRYFHFGTAYEHKYSKLENVYLNNGYCIYSVIPSLLVLSIFEDIFEKNKKYFVLNKSEGYLTVNNLYFKNFSIIEKNGIYVDPELFFEFFNKKKLICESLVHTQYNLYSSTGRPSNRFGGVNYSALEKKSGCRKSFISRFGDDGILCMFDFSAFHPRLISNLINYKFEYDDEIYKDFAKQLNEGEYSEEKVSEVKTLIFEILYGGIENKLSKTLYFRMVNEYIESLWKFFQEYGYIETTLLKRKITKDILKDCTPNKVFNYLLQSYEFEFSLELIDQINNILNDHECKLILYTYDSFLFDLPKNEIGLLTKIRDILEKNKTFPTKLYFGKNYNEMIKIDKIN